MQSAELPSVDRLHLRCVGRISFTDGIFVTVRTGDGVDSYKIAEPRAGEVEGV